MNAEEVLDLSAIFGVRARITRSAEATGGGLVEMECIADPGSGTMVHFHPEQEETFSVLEGQLELLHDGRRELISAGQDYTVPKGTVHSWRNPGPATVRFSNVHRPARGFEAHMRTLDRLVREGKIRGKNDPRSLIYMSMSAVRHRPDVTVKPPQWLVNTMASVGHLLRYRLGDEGGR